MPQNEPTIDKMNETIALFMGYERYEDQYGIWFKREGLIKCMHPKLQELAYHISWSALMEGWYKFIALRFESPMKQFRHSELKTIAGYAILYGGITIAHKNIYEGIQ